MALPLLILSTGPDHTDCVGQIGTVRPSKARIRAGCGNGLAKSTCLLGREGLRKRIADLKGKSAVTKEFAPRVASGPGCRELD